MRNIPLNAVNLQAYREAGYKHYLQYITKSPVTGAWIAVGYPTTLDALSLHIIAIDKKVKAGVYREPIVIPLDLNAVHASRYHVWAAEQNGQFAE